MSRTENLITALINGETVGFKPQSRIEKILKNCCDKCGCDNLPRPQSRVEALLYQLAEQLANGGGGGGGGSAIVEGTAIPVGEKVEKIYFNSALSAEETNAYLSQLTYAEGIINNPCYIVFANSKGFGLGVEKLDEENYSIFHMSVKSTGEIWIARYYSSNHYQPWFNQITEQQIDASYNTGTTSELYMIPSAIFTYYGDFDSSFNDFDGFPVGTENEKIKNVLSITPFGASSTSNEPTAYTVSSVNELPTNAVEGSLAIVNETVILDGQGTWVFNDELPNLGQSFEAWEEGTSPFEILFSSGNLNFEGFTISTQGSSSWGIYCLMYAESGSTSHLAYTHNPDRSYGIKHGWDSEAYKTLTVSYADREAIKWLNAHATQTEKGEEIAEIYSSLYTYENGKWVYKCEVA